MSILPALRGFWLQFFFGCLILSGCASFKTIDILPVEPTSSVLEESRNGWWYVRFNWQWPVDTPPAWHLDLFAAHQLILPVINAYQEDLPLWRIHRRAARDDAGHQFSLIFYATTRTARAIYEDFATDPLLADFVAAGMIRQVQTSQLVGVRQPAISDTSDPIWSPAMQASWPHYIFGVSRMWLNLVSDTANPLLLESKPVTLAQTVEVYREVDAEITRIWQEEGRHALMHHLNAIFGYQPIPIVEKQWINF